MREGAAARSGDDAIEAGFLQLGIGHEKPPAAGGKRVPHNHPQPALGEGSLRGVFEDGLRAGRAGGITRSTAQSKAGFWQAARSSRRATASSSAAITQTVPFSLRAMPHRHAHRIGRVGTRAGAGKAQQRKGCHHPSPHGADSQSVGSRPCTRPRFSPRVLVAVSEAHSSPASLPRLMKVDLCTALTVKGPAPGLQPWRLRPLFKALT